MDNKIVKIKVNNLFGFLKHDVQLRDEGVTFIHGPNGCGKTTFLKLIAAIFELDIVTVNDINFESVEIHYNNESKVFIKKEVKVAVVDNEKIKYSDVKFSYHEKNKKPVTYEYNNDKGDMRISHYQIDDYFPFLTQIDVNKWVNRRTSEILSYAEVHARYANMLPGINHIRRKLPDWLSNIKNQSKLHFIQTQRLLKVTGHEKNSHREEKNISNVIELYSSEMKDRISNLLAASAEFSQSKDRSFPQRLLSLEIDESLSEETIRDNYKKTEDKIEKLMNSGLIQQEKNISLPSKKFEATEKKVLSLYLQDINEKLSVFDDLQLRIETFLSIVFPKLRNKTFKINQKDGFLIETTQGENQILRPSQLSSGEQHEIVLFYELIFKTSDSSFFLIDEPEISLHIDWQRQFLSDISKIAHLGKHSFLIATHSPQIIGTRRDLAVSLDGGILND